MMNDGWYMMDVGFMTMMMIDDKSDVWCMMYDRWWMIDDILWMMDNEW